MNSKTFLDNPAVTRVLFHPRREVPFDSPGRGLTVHLEVELGIHLGAKVHPATSGGPLILFWHGNGEIAADYDDIAQIYTQMGIHFLVVDYRGYGLSDGAPKGTHLLKDAVRVMNQLEELLAKIGVYAGKRFVMGRSLGSAAAIETAFRVPNGLAGLIIESGFAFSLPLLERLGGVSFPGVGEHQGFGNYEKIARVTLPTLIIHGEQDQIIPITDGQMLHRQAGSAKKRLLTLPYAGHNNLMMVGQQRYFETIRTFVFENQ